MSIKTYFKQIFGKFRLTAEEPNVDDCLAELEDMQVVSTLPAVEKMLPKESKKAVRKIVSRRKKKLEPEICSIAKKSEKQNQVPTSFIKDNFTFGSTLRMLHKAKLCTSRACSILYRYRIVTIRDFMDFYPKNKENLSSLNDLGAIGVADVISLYKKLYPYFSSRVEIRGNSVEYELVAYVEACGHLNRSDKLALECYCFYYIRTQTICPETSPSMYPGLAKLLFQLSTFERSTYIPAVLLPLYKQLKQILRAYFDGNFQTQAIMKELWELIPENLYQELNRKVQFMTHFDSLDSCRHFLFQQRYVAVCKEIIENKRTLSLLEKNLQLTDVLHYIFTVPTMDDQSLFLTLGEMRIRFPFALIEGIEREIAAIANYSSSVVFNKTIQYKWGYTETTPFVYPYYLCHGRLPLFFLLQQKLTLKKKGYSSKFIYELLYGESPKNSLLIEMLDNHSLWAYDELQEKTFLLSDSPEIETIRARELISLSSELVIRILAYTHKDTFCLFGCDEDFPTNQTWNKLWLIDKALTRYIDFNDFYRLLRLSYLDAVKTNGEIDVRQLLAKNAKVKLNGIVAVEDELFKIGVSMLMNDIMKS